MMLPQLLVFILVGKWYTEAALSDNSFPEFEIKELFRNVYFNFYWTKEQFALAKKVSSGNSHCQWTELALTDVKPNDLPVEDKGKNCIFAPVNKDTRGDYKFHSERIIDEFIEQKGYDRGDYDFYTYFSPCSICKEGYPRNMWKPKPTPPLPPTDFPPLPPLKFDEYAGRYYSEPSSVQPVPSNFKKIWSDKLYHKSNKGWESKGLEALRLGS